MAGRDDTAIPHRGSLFFYYDYIDINIKIYTKQQKIPFSRDFMDLINFMDLPTGRQALQT